MTPIHTIRTNRERGRVTDLERGLNQEDIGDAVLVIGGSGAGREARGASVCARMARFCGGPPGRRHLQWRRAGTRKIVPAVVPHAVDEEGRRAVDTAAGAAQKVFADAIGMPVLDHVTLEADEIERDETGVGQQVRVVERVLMLEQRVVHFPECALRRRGLGRFGRVLRVRVARRHREMPEHEPHVIGREPLQLLDDRMRLTAVRAFEIAILEHRDRRIGWSPDMVALVNWKRQQRRVGLSFHWSPLFLVDPDG